MYHSTQVCPTHYINKEPTHVKFCCCVFLLETERVHRWIKCLNLGSLYSTWEEDWFINKKLSCNVIQGEREVFCAVFQRFMMNIESIIMTHSFLLFIITKKNKYIEGMGKQYVCYPLTCYLCFSPTVLKIFCFILFSLEI